MHKNIKNIINNKYGRLTVISMSKERGERKQIKYNCICDCGNKHLVTGESLRGGKSKSCGCLRNEEPPNKIQDRELAVWKHIYNSTIKKRNKKRGIKGDISLDDFMFLSKKPCFYCGLENSNVMQDRRGWNKNKKVSGIIVKFNGIDRVNSSKGYTKNNSVACCKYCNTAKNVMSKKDFLKFIKRIYEYNF